MSIKTCQNEQQATTTTSKRVFCFVHNFVLLLFIFLLFKAARRHQSSPSSVADFAIIFHQPLEDQTLFFTKALTMRWDFFLFCFVAPVVRASLMIGMVTKDAAILSSTSDFNKNGVAMRADYDWIQQIGQHCLMGLQGDPSDCNFIASQIEAINREHELTYNDRSLSCRSIAHLFRKIIANHLRKNRLQVCAMIAGWDHERDCPVLYWLDSIGSLQEVPYAAHGHEFPFVWSLLDSKNREASALVSKMDTTDGLISDTDHVPSSETISTSICDHRSSPPSSLSSRSGFRDLTINDALAVVDSCFAAARKRTMGRCGSFQIKSVTNKGCSNHHRSLLD